MINIEKERVDFDLFLNSLGDGNSYVARARSNDCIGLVKEAYLQRATLAAEREKELLDEVEKSLINRINNEGQLIPLMLRGIIKKPLIGSLLSLYGEDEIKQFVEGLKQ